MRTFIIRARHGTTRSERVQFTLGTKGHFEVIAHSVINAFFVSNGFREAVEVYIVLESSADFPRTLKLSSAEGLSLAGFHEAAVLDLVVQALKMSDGLEKNATCQVAAGITVSGFGFEKLLQQVIATRPVYLLDRKGDDIRTTSFLPDPVFVLSDHLAMPKNHVKCFTRQGLKTVSLGKKMLFAAQCVVLIHDELDRQNFLNY